VLKAGAAHGLCVCGLDSMDIRRIEAGILNNVSDMDETMNPFQAGLGVFVDMKKPDFIGKAALANADRGVLLHGLKCADGEPYIHGEVCSNGKPVGRVTAAAWSPYLKCETAIVRLENANSRSAGGITVRLRDGTMKPASLVDLPMYDLNKAIPRGLDKTIPDRA